MSGSYGQTGHGLSPAGAEDVAKVVPVLRSRTMAPSNVVRFGVIGYGYWGPNVVRNLHQLENAQMVAVCDKNDAALRRAGRTYPQLRLTTDYCDVLESPEIDAVAVV